MADKEEQTEEPTGKRLSEANDKGQVAVSREISTLFVLAGATISLLGILPWSLRPLLRLLRTLIERPDQFSLGTGAALQSLVAHVEETMALTLGPVFALLLFAAVVATVGQTGFIWSPSKI